MQFHIFDLSIRYFVHTVRYKVVVDTFEATQGRGKGMGP